MNQDRVDELLAQLKDQAAPAILECEDVGESERRAVVDKLNETGWLVALIDGSTVSDKDSLLAAIAAAFHFPSYFGANWDALLDCLSDFHWQPAPGYALLVTKAHSCCATDPDEAQVFRDVWQDAADRWSERDDSPAFKMLWIR
ncbi:MAG: barstar family protein [Planctomycetia bacterium]